MTPSVSLLAFALACASARQGASGARRFDVTLPPDIAARETHLVLRNVEVPRNRAVVLRAYAVAAGDTQPVYLGSAGIPGVSPTASGKTALGVVTVIVTRGIRQWVSAHPGAKTISIEIRPTTGRDTTRVDWSALRVELVHPD